MPPHRASRAVTVCEMVNTFRTFRVSSHRSAAWINCRRVSSLMRPFHRSGALKASH